MTFQPDRPYNDLPSLPPREDVETKAVPGVDGIEAYWREKI